MSTKRLHLGRYDDYIWKVFNEEYVQSGYYNDPKYHHMSNTGRFNLFLQTLDIGVHN